VPLPTDPGPAFGAIEPDRQQWRAAARSTSRGTAFDGTTLVSPGYALSAFARERAAPTSHRFQTDHIYVVFRHRIIGKRPAIAIACGRPDAVRNSVVLQHGNLRPPTPRDCTSTRRNGCGRTQINLSWIASSSSYRNLGTYLLERCQGAGLLQFSLQIQPLRRRPPIRLPGF